MKHQPTYRQLIVIALLWAAHCLPAHAGGKNTGPNLNSGKLPSIPAVGGLNTPQINLTPVVLPSVDAAKIQLGPAGGGFVPGGDALNPNVVPGAQLPQINIPGVDAADAYRVIAVLTSKTGAQVPVEGQKALSGELFEGKRTAAPGENAPVAGSESNVPSLNPSTTPDGSPTPTPPAPKRTKKARSASDRFKDWATYKKLYYQSMWWYTITHIGNMWPGYQQKIADGRARGTLPMENHREFFAHMRVMGLTGRFYVLGYAPRDDNDVAREARETFAKYFTNPAVGQKERDAFNRFVDRARNYNAARRNKTNFRKHLRDALLAVAVKPVGEMADYFDARLKNDAKKQTEGFQKSGGAQAVLDGFRETVLQTLAEENPNSKSRIVAAVLLGSFASGGPTMTSDFDVEAVAADGGNADLKGFMTRLEANWAARLIVVDGKPVSAHAQHPVTVHDHATRPSRGVLDKIHYTDYLVFSHDPELVAELQRAPGEPPPFTTSYKMGVIGRIQRFMQYSAVLARTYLADLETRLKRKP